MPGPPWAARGLWSLQLCMGSISCVSEGGGKRSEAAVLLGRLTKVNHPLITGCKTTSQTEAE